MSLAEAAEFARKALAVQPDSPHFETTWMLAAEGAGQFAELLEEVEARRRKEPAAVALLMREFALLCAAGRRADAEERWRQYEIAHAERMGARAMRSVQTVLRAMAAYQEGKIDEYVQIAGQMSEPAWKFAAAITRMDAAGAAAHLAAMESPDLTERLWCTRRPGWRRMRNSPGGTGPARSQASVTPVSTATR